MIQRAGRGREGLGFCCWIMCFFLCLDLPRCAWKGAKSPVKSPAHLPSNTPGSQAQQNHHLLQVEWMPRRLLGELEVSLHRPRPTELLNGPLPSLHQPAHGLSLDSLDVVGRVQANLAAVQASLAPTLLILVLYLGQLIPSLETQLIVFLPLIVIEGPNSHFRS